MQIKTYTPEDHKVKALIYGGSGSGKTVFGGTAKNALFLSAENGLLSIKDKKPEYIEIKSLKDLRDAYKYLRDEKHAYTTVVIDSITEISDVIKCWIEKKYDRQMQIQDWGELKKELVNIFKSFRDLPLHVIIIAQDDRIVDAEQIHRIVPSLDGKGAVAALPYHMDIVGYTRVDKGGYKIETMSHPKYVTKDRSGLIGNDCPPDFEEWKNRVKTIKTEKQKVKEVDVDSKPDNDPLFNLIAGLKKMGAEDDKECTALLNQTIGSKIADIRQLTAEQAENALKKLNK